MSLQYKICSKGPKSMRRKPIQHAAAHRASFPSSQLLTLHQFEMRSVCSEVIIEFLDFPFGLAASSPASTRRRILWKKTCHYQRALEDYEVEGSDSNTLL